MTNLSMLPRLLICLAVCVLPTLLTGCASMRPAPVGGQVFVRGQNDEMVWEKTVDVVHDYFAIERENHFDNVIETHYKVGASLLEPWHHDTVGFENRLESTLQSIRRKAFIHVTPTGDGHLVSVQVYREREDVPAEPKNSPGGATFRQYVPLQRELEIDEDDIARGRWIPIGRDPRLEQEMLTSLQSRLSR